ncbi:hypothetical protein CAXC1_180015 [Candidatus Xenohaliotis californiensis]|uniref:WH2 domain-containing protein n=1 Tax=Candidatus Xenohaliotis californiensis TaxID=84677 RepID=A0ABM9N7C4_9RICK|nr:hypothetical protein CAXC1_180015 [Candidatus Xenohaliotis californiensis]
MNIKFYSTCCRAPSTDSNATNHPKLGDKKKGNVLSLVNHFENLKNPSVDKPLYKDSASQNKKIKTQKTKWQDSNKSIGKKDAKQHNPPSQQKIAADKNIVKKEDRENLREILKNKLAARRQSIAPIETANNTPELQAVPTTPLSSSGTHNDHNREVKTLGNINYGHMLDMLKKKLNKLNAETPGYEHEAEERSKNITATPKHNVVASAPSSVSLGNTHTAHDREARNEHNNVMSELKQKFGKAETPGYEHEAEERSKNITATPKHNVVASAPSMPSEHSSNLPSTNKEITIKNKLVQELKNKFSSGSLSGFEKIEENNISNYNSVAMHNNNSGLHR